MLIYEHRNLLANRYIPTAIDPQRIQDFSQKCYEADQDIKSDRASDILGFYSLPEYDTSRIKDFVSSLDPRFDTMVVLGIGGSALGNKALYNALKTERNLQRKLFVFDNVDPVYLYEILSGIDLERTLFNVITKSGTTAETMAGYMILLDLIKTRFPHDYRKRVIITTDKEKGFLRQIINQEGYASFVVPDNVGGRFSVLTDVGLLSSAFAGIDIDKLLQGAATMRKRCENPDIMANPAYLNGLLHFLYMREGKNISVMMPYSNSCMTLPLVSPALGRKPG
jgi:glucose-6-phosphate isomerase